MDGLGQATSSSEDRPRRCVRFCRTRGDRGFSRARLEKGLTGDSNSESSASGPVNNVVRPPCRSSAAELRRRRRRLLRDMPPLEAHSARFAGRAVQALRPIRCHCAEGRGHGPKLYLSVSMLGQRPQMDYVPNANSEEVRTLVDNFNKARAILNESAPSTPSFSAAARSWTGMGHADAATPDGSCNESGHRCVRFRQGGRHHRQHGRVLSCSRRPAARRQGDSR